ncbi:TPA: hypothetical protein P7W98_003805 [Escherichia coli]|uniref:hypothetical protein n=1 Tax=Enterobacteriaceae TaxID=543 RepID=UPI00193CD6E7|nr:MULTISPECIES: hypothetical protein [Enterobacteriaceae]EJY6350638.1 hypothetical protein [Escherichia coli]MBM3072874.1 hypothetical protein [Lelliottia sp. RWM.1]MDX4986596.1 hypothetical protein [Escherichia coli]HBN0910835.1 hypothetical protein [Escherichia coli]HBN1124805.1 hypothetical protein [Escherichia coli]
MTAQEEVLRLLSRYSNLLEHSDFVYGRFDNLQPRTIREFHVRKKLLDNFIAGKDPQKIEMLTAQDFASPRDSIPDEIIRIIGSRKQLTPFVDNIWLTEYPFITALLQSDLMGKVKWTRGKSGAVSFTHNDREIDLVGVVLFLTGIGGFTQKAVFQFIAIHGSRAGVDSECDNPGQLSKAAEAIQKTYGSLKSEWEKLNFSEGSLQAEIKKEK